jgi:membrane protein
MTSPASPTQGSKFRLRRASVHVVRHPGTFALGVLRAFRANQGLLLAGAVAYYTLLSIVPLLILLLIGLAHFVEPARLFTTLTDYLEFLLPGQSDAVMDQLRVFLAHRDEIGGVLLGSLLIFSAMAFTVLENAMSVIFYHRVAIRRRRFVISAIMPYLFILFLGLGLLAATIVSGRLAAMATHHVAVLGVPHSLGDLSSALLYLMGVAGEILVLTSIYLVMPVGRVSWQHALIGGVTAGLLWEISRHVIVWYYGTMSHIQEVYGSLTTAIAVLLSVEIAAVFLLLGAQVIAEYERIGRGPDADGKPPGPTQGLRTSPPLDPSASPE